MATDGRKAGDNSGGESGAAACLACAGQRDPPVPAPRGLPEPECPPGLDPEDCGKKFPRMNTYVTLNGHRLVDSIVLTNGLKFSPLRMPA